MNKDQIIAAIVALNKVAGNEKLTYAVRVKAEKRLAELLELL